MTRRQPGQQQPAIGISVAQIVAGALASVTAAVIASYFGIGGTLIGAAITSVVATVGGALYKLSLESAQARVVRVTRNPRTGELTREVTQEPIPTRPTRQIRWGLVASAFVLVFSLAIGTVTAIEVAAKEPLAAVLGRQGTTPGETSVGSVVQSVAETAPAPTASPAEPPSSAPSTVPGFAMPTAEGTARTNSPAPSTAPGAAPSTAPGPTTPPATTPTPHPAPTVAPTAAPALTPTVRAPSAAPTQAAPSSAPASAPTQAAPTQAPAVLPTQVPLAPAQPTTAPVQP